MISTVKELIEALQILPPDMKIFLNGRYYDGGSLAAPIYSAEIWDSALTPDGKQVIVHIGTGTYPNNEKEFLEHNPKHKLTEKVAVIE